MTRNNHTGVVPEQISGASIEAESSIACDLSEAKIFFGIVKKRLLNVNGWHTYAGTLSAKFHLVDEKGNEVQRQAQKGDYFKIDIPGPGSMSGEGYDWVQIEDMERTSSGDTESFGFRVRPAQNPQNEDRGTAHFYSPESTSSFVITREQNTITVAIYDRNTKPNTDAATVADKVRHAVVGSGGILAFSKFQWKSLADGLLKKDAD